MGTGLTPAIVIAWAGAVAYILIDVVLAGFYIGLILLLFALVREMLWKK